ncbi:MAG: polysaccharide deacetylase family protein [Myxococcota bacterium]|nr:polysaccharide deacetylase family protein [Myxococcota bacterium]
MNRIGLATWVLSAISACAADLASVDDEHAHVDELAESRLFEAAYEAADDDKADGNDCSGVWVPDRPPFDRVVALTFDDGPVLPTTAAIVQTLRAHDVPAAFFINGARVQSREAERLLKDLVTDPRFLLANHSWSHPNMTTLSAASVERQIDDTTSVLEAAGERPRYFRFPYGASTCATARAVRERGYVVTGWHVDSADWCYAAGGGYCSRSRFRYVDDDVRGDMVAYVLRQVRARGGGILLFHDVHAWTASQLDRLIRALKAEGYRFTSLDDAAVFPKLNGSVPPPSGDPAARPAPGGGVAMPAPPSTIERARTTTALNLRSGPGTEHAILHTMPAGSIVTLLGDRRGDWLHVEYRGTRGWAHGRHLERL